MTSLGRSDGGRPNHAAASFWSSRQILLTSFYLSPLWPTGGILSITTSFVVSLSNFFVLIVATEARAAVAHLILEKHDLTN